jgi:hypothetical protein
MSYASRGRDFAKLRTNEVAAKQIEEYWLAKGYRVKTDTVSYTDTVHGITSDTIAGLPEELFYERMAAIKVRSR